MKACPTSIRKNAIEHYYGNDISENDRKMNDKFFYYLQAYCCEMKYSELDILLNDEHYESVFHLFENVMLGKKEVA